MIGRITGRVVGAELTQLLVDVGGVAYEVDVPLTTAYDLANQEGPVTLYTHLVVRDDAHHLYGFARQEDRKLFRELIKVNSVGPKLALAVLSGLDRDGFARTVRAGDAKALTAIPGVGKLTAERIILDMRERLPAKDDAGEDAPNTGADAEAALVELGYKPREAARAVAEVADDADDVEGLIRLALKRLVRS